MAQSVPSIHSLIDRLISIAVDNFKAAELHLSGREEEELIFFEFILFFFLKIFLPFGFIRFNFCQFLRVFSKSFFQSRQKCISIILNLWNEIFLKSFFFTRMYEKKLRKQSSFFAKNY